jgi:hypothetical protein
MFSTTTDDVGWMMKRDTHKLFDHWHDGSVLVRQSVHEKKAEQLGQEFRSVASEEHDSWPDCCTHFPSHQPQDASKVQASHDV